MFDSSHTLLLGLFKKLESESKSWSLKLQYMVAEELEKHSYISASINCS